MKVVFMKKKTFLLHLFISTRGSQIKQTRRKFFAGGTNFSQTKSAKQFKIVFLQKFISLQNGFLDT